MIEKRSFEFRPDVAMAAFVLVFHAGIDRHDKGFSNHIIFRADTPASDDVLGGISLDDGGAWIIVAAP